MEDSTPTDKSDAIPVDIGIGAIGECVLWAGWRDRQGYGSRTVNGRTVKAHRYAWACVHGDPGEWCVLHRCDNPSCINVDHLFLGTRADNIADMDAKGRRSHVGARGEQNGNTKLTVDQVRDIRASSESGVVIARRFGISGVAVSSIRLRKTWKHLP